MVIAQLEEKNTALFQAQKKQVAVKKDINRIWLELEKNCNINEIKRMEDDLREKTRKLEFWQKEARNQNSINFKNEKYFMEVNNTISNEERKGHISYQLIQTQNEFKHVRA